MNFLSLIEAKRDGHALTPEQISAFVADYTAEAIPDYQVAALLMAVLFKGLSSEETTALTLAMRDSGEKLQLPSSAEPVVDKHSTGGVGDKVSLPLAPLLASLGFRVPMISGRGLGITGGTLDKLDSIPGFRTILRTNQITQIIESCGCVICGQTSQMVPADRKLYALRDATATVPSIPLIVSSILSKKLAEGLHALVLDVKFGEAAFMTTRDQALELACRMVELSARCGVKTKALVTRMDAPLGSAAGNWLEVKEAVRCLRNQGPADLEELVVRFAAELLVITGKEKEIGPAIQRALACLRSGEPERKWEAMLAAQGADLEAYHAKLRADPHAAWVVECIAESDGFITGCSARAVGELVRDLGGGRLTKDSGLFYEVGVDALLKPGDTVRQGQSMGRVHAATEAAAHEGARRLAAAFRIGLEPPQHESIVADSITADSLP